jgi:FixJ family two-component response regulator
MRLVKVNAIMTIKRAGAADTTLSRPASREESLTEALAAAGRKLHEALSRQRETGETLQALLDGAGITVLFLDSRQNIRFFSPAAGALFHLIAGDIGRPITDLAALSHDRSLSADAAEVLRTPGPLNREIETPGGLWYARRAAHCRTDAADMVVLTYIDITERKRWADALAEARRQAQLDEVTKAGFLAAANRNMRRPLKALERLRQLLADAVDADQRQTLVACVDEAIGAIGGMTETLLDSDPIANDAQTAALAICPIDAGPPDRHRDVAIAEQPHDDPDSTVVFVVDDDRRLRGAVRLVLEGEGHVVEDFESCEAFLDAWRPGRGSCLLIDAGLPGISGIDLLHRLRDIGARLPAIVITGGGDVPMAVEAMKAGALDFIEKPISRRDLLASVEGAIELSRDSSKLSARRELAAGHIASLTPRQREVMEMVLAGHPSKNIAADLGISQRTVENHRAAIMQKTGSASLPALARLALAAIPAGADAPPPPQP